MADAAGAAATDKREKKRSFTVEEKLAIVAASKTASLRAVARRFNVDRNCVRSWREKEAQLAELHPNARRLPGAGRRPSAASAAGKRRAEATNESQEKKLKTIAPKQVQVQAAGQDEVQVQEVPVSDQQDQVLADFLLIGFQGKEGAFSDVAARNAFEELKTVKALTPSEFETVGYSQVAHVVDAVERGEVEYAVLPVENSISGTFHGILDRLVASHLKIVGEVACVQELCLCAVSEATIGDIDCLLSHPAVLDHCENYISALERVSGAIIERQATWDSAGACQIVKQEGERHVAAIASEQAAIAHGLVVMEKGIGDELNSETRYMILGRLDALPLPLGTSPGTTSLSTRPLPTTKSSIVVAVPNEPQALFKIVSAFALRNVMIVKIESRPAATAGTLFAVQTTHWDYIFYIDYITSQDPTQEVRLRSNLEEFALWVKDLGTYSSSGSKANVEPPRWKSVVNAIAC
ncbi:hypothetical protein BBO99_00001783 [Phytophthora kernoviae]|uniref:Prephenate dehydratase n=2 Tax=Phytophthora kernoviae TaxID=325452 RepID=A0A421F8A9_9STRA|nr:hypothetical protein G195_002584 [Phytophthora kernoviae 00238/432]KAG2526118.1 hypothetical protein JM16_004077 [Phytophthora kernoviae]KAG2532080.1 hypothetical protein JM18_001449 [Phytophthora kernoviae]RLN27198.1 hypothetical protein BBI17_001554 [Phytophthora kernoviae]RLN83793.1 hypothetical protein BBO99_00001783 [Phytophthora kernoviae]